MRALRFFLQRDHIAGVDLDDLRLSVSVSGSVSVSIIIIVITCY